MDTTNIQILQFDFSGITAHDILIGEYGLGFMFGCMILALAASVFMKYKDMVKSVETIKDFDWKYSLYDNGIKMIFEFFSALALIRAIDIVTPIVLKKLVEMGYVQQPELIPVPVVVLVVSIGIGFIVHWSVPRMSLKKLLDPNL